jgi:hypothetical protein
VRDFPHAAAAERHPEGLSSPRVENPGRESTNEADDVANNDEAEQEVTYPTSAGRDRKQKMA